MCAIHGFQIVDLVCVDDSKSFTDGIFCCCDERVGIGRDRGREREGGSCNE